jgi:hypothetical protein
MQSGFPVDDVAAFTPNGIIVIQAKKGLRLSANKDSALAEALLQSVQMFRAGRPSDEAAQQTNTDWDPLSDRIVIATDGGAPKSIREDLARVVARLATAPAAASVDQLTNNEGERTALTRLTDHVQRLWISESGATITAEEGRAFFSVLRIIGLDLNASGRDHLAAMTILNAVLVNNNQVSAAWSILLRECQDLASDRLFTTPNQLRSALGGQGIGIQIPALVGVTSGPVYEPDAVLRGPLASGMLHDRLTAAEAVENFDPAAAAAEYAAVMADLEEKSFSYVAGELAPKLARALRASGKHSAAIDAAVAAAWRPLRAGDVPSVFPEAWRLQEELRKSSQIESLTGDAVVAILQYEAGQDRLPSVIERVMKIGDDDEYAAELILWCSEEAIATGQTHLFELYCDRALKLATTILPHAREYAGRLKIAVAEVSNSWDQLLATMEADVSAELYALATARRGQALAWKNELADAVGYYERAIAGGATAKMYTEARSWLYDLRTLSGAWQGPRRDPDPHFTAQSLPYSHKISAFAGKNRLLARGLEALAENEPERAHRIFSRLRHRAAVGASMATHRQACTYISDALAASGNSTAAVAGYLQAGNYEKASNVIKRLPDEPLVTDPEWVTGSPWSVRAAYAFVGDHGDLVPESIAKSLFDSLADRLITDGTIQGWSNFQANEQLIKPLASLVWASSIESAKRLLERTAALATHGRMAREHVNFVLGCARVHSELAPLAADQFCDLLISSELAVPSSIETALKWLQPAHQRLVERLYDAFRSTQSPWLAQVLIALEPRAPEFVNYVNAALERSTKAREYDPSVTSFGSEVIEVARLSPAGDPALRERFISAMLKIALEAREPHIGRQEAVDAIATLIQRCGLASLEQQTLLDVATGVRELVASAGVTTYNDEDFPWMGSPAQLTLAATRLLLILAEDTDEQVRLVNTLLITFLNEDVASSYVMSSALAQAPAALYSQNLLVLATSRSPDIRALAAHRWAELPSANPEIGRKLAKDPAGKVRRALAYGLSQTERPDCDDILALLAADCRFSIRVAVARTS